MKKILITGAFGFLGEHLVTHYKNIGYFVYAIGNTKIKNHLITKITDNYIIGNVTVENLQTIDIDFDVIIHCAGGSSVGASMENPLNDLNKSTVGTENILEYIRLYYPYSKMIYISSAAVYGDKYTSPISITDKKSPMSFYGIHKSLSEDLCEFYVNRFNLNITILRFFSIYGIGLKKQLLWDSCNKINSNVSNLTFFGTGEEIRDWIEISDAIYVIDLAINSNKKFQILNAGTGQEIKVKTIIEKLIKLFDSDKSIYFNKKTKIGDPKYLCAKTTKLLKNKVSLDDGLARYVQWYKGVKDAK